MLRTALASLAVSLAVAFAAPAFAQVGADLNISPKRVVFKNGERNATVHIFNQGDEPATYTVEMTDRVMTPDGQISPLAEGAARPAWSAVDLVQYTPRRVTLQPKSSQAVRIRLRDGVAGEERRSHLTVTALPPESTGLTAAAAAASAGQDQLALQVIGMFSVSIPVIVREGAAPSRAEILDPVLVAAQGQDKPRVTFTVTRQGGASIYGDVEVYAGEGRRRRLVGKTRGVAVYPEIGQRAFSIPLTETVAHSEPLKIVYLDDDQKPGAELAAVSFAAP
ncbi:MAG: hypothetical protein BGN86_10215 [Caulobacterales bacterium 68-7]|nr:MAG: hypothetical protein BGN86_10215 [Caulobacterales bacterium 68-7]